MSAENNERIKNKIKALLSKTTAQGASKEEMESALRKATQLMSEYFITENDLSEDNISKCRHETFPIVKSGYDLSFFYADLAHLFDCQYYYGKYNITFFGFENDINLCGYFYNMIVKTCLSEKDKYMKSDEFLRLKLYYHGKTLASSFVKGFLYNVVVRIQKMYEEREKSMPEAYGLVLIQKKDKIKKEFFDQHPNLKIRKGEREIKAESVAFKLGYKKGSEIALTQAISDARVSNSLLLN